MLETSTSPSFEIGISEIVQNKINFLLSRFKKTEWSGPAWYRIDKVDTDNFPVEVSLQYFKPIHLGHGTETELDGDKMGKLLPGIYKRFPDLKDCYLGLIHSHHTMGAFLSETDKDTAKEQAVKDGIFFSTVVASSGEPFDCCLTYKDQFGFTNLIEGEIVVPELTVEIPKEWKTEATKIEKAKEAENRITYVKKPTNQLSAFGIHRNSDYGYGSYNDYTDVPFRSDVKAISAPKTMEISLLESQKMNALCDKLDSNTLTYHSFIEECRKECPNIDPHLYVDTQRGLPF